MSDTAAPLGRRERKKQETRAALRHAALDLFTRKGYRETRVADIAEAADVSEATFFRYFASKEEVALVGLLAGIEEVLEALTQRPVEERPLQACLAVMDTPGALDLLPGPDRVASIKLLGQSRTLAGHFSWRMYEISDRLAVEFARRLDVPTSALEPRLLANAVMGALNAVLWTWLLDPQQEPLALTREALQSLARGLEPGTA